MLAKQKLCGEPGVEDSGWVAVRFRSTTLPELGADAVRIRRAFPRGIVLPGEHYELLGISPGNARRREHREARSAADVLAQLGETPSVARSTPVFQVGGQRVFATDRIVVGFEPEKGRPTRFLQARDEVLAIRDDSWVIRLDAEDDPYLAARAWAKQAGIRFAHPDFAGLTPWVDATAPQPEEKCPPHDVGYAVRLVRAQEALKVQPGKSAVRVAVLDAGVDPVHRDLTPVRVTGYDYIDNDADPRPIAADFHGTACAALSAAVPRDAMSVLGAGSGCSVVPIRIFVSVREPSGGRSWSWTVSGIVSGIRRAWQDGADVLCMSWTLPLGCPEVEEELNRARHEGRGKLGCVLVAGTGNSGGRVQFPATLDYVLAVAGTNRFDVPKTLGSDNEPWGSCRGPEVDIAAPGVRVCTADNTGADGTNKSASPQGDYMQLSGTSASTALAAGAAALVLCKNASLTEQAVRDLLCRNAEKVRTVTYDANGHNDQVGFGRLDIEAAVRAA